LHSDCSFPEYWANVFTELGGIEKALETAVSNTDKLEQGFEAALAVSTAVPIVVLLISTIGRLLVSRLPHAFRPGGWCHFHHFMFVGVMSKFLALVCVWGAVGVHLPISVIVQDGCDLLEAFDLDLGVGLSDPSFNI
jgi:hypothetical protein